jgi:hypothetical protein
MHPPITPTVIAAVFDPPFFTLAGGSVTDSVRSGSVSVLVASVGFAVVFVVVVRGGGGGGGTIAVVVGLAMVVVGLTTVVSTTADVPLLFWAITPAKRLKIKSVFIF